jgi:hypothetical protein
VSGRYSGMKGVCSSMPPICRDKKKLL